MSNLSTSPETSAFITYLEKWYQALEIISFKAIAPDASRTAVISVDMINGFCLSGPLASPRVAKIKEPIVKLLESSWNYGIRNIILAQDSHDPDSKEFSAFPPHCVVGTPESETIDEIKNLPFFDQMVIIKKKSLSTHIGTDFDKWRLAHQDIDSFIVVGDCTDLCVYNLAMHLQMEATSKGMNQRVIIPASCVDTYDISLETAKQINAFPHPGDFFHLTFMYHLALNGIEIYQSIQ